jgi:hypothetical protein
MSYNYLMEESLKSLSEIIEMTRTQDKNNYLEFVSLENRIVEEKRAPSLPCHLYYKYIVNKKSIRYIARELGIESKWQKLWILMGKIGIEMRSLSDAQKIRSANETSEQKNKRLEGYKLKMSDPKFLKEFSESLRKGASDKVKMQKAIKMLGPGAYRPTREGLYNMMWKEGLSAIEIAERCKVYRGTVYGWMQSYNMLPKRSYIRKG